MPNFEDVLDGEGPGVTATYEFQGPTFSAKAFVFSPQAHSTPWAGFLREGFPDVIIGRSSAPSALLVVRATAPKPATDDLMFALAFGPAGRFLMRPDSFTRGYGLRTALNLIYPRSSVAGARLRAVDSKRRGQTVVRSRMQSSAQAEFEMFDVNRLQDVLGKAVGVPAVSSRPRRNSAASRSSMCAMMPRPATGPAGSRSRRAGRRRCIAFRMACGFQTDMQSEASS